MKKRSLSLIFVMMFFTFIFVFGLIGCVSALTGVRLGITGTIGDYSSKVVLRTDDNAVAEFDSYDMPIPSMPDSDNAQFYSSITSASLAIDSWNSVAREVDLVYSVPPGDSGDVTFSWNKVTGTNYKATFTITGMTGVDMSSASSYTYSAPNDNDIYITVKVEDYPSSTPTGDTGGSSGGGGGGGVMKQPNITVVLNNTGSLLFDAGVFISDEFRNIEQGQKMQSQFNLIPMGNDPYLDVTLKYNVKKSDGSSTGIEESETILVTGQKGFVKEFATQTLGPGDYILNLELIYETSPGKSAVATASSHFTVTAKGDLTSSVGKGLSIFGNYKWLIAVLFIGILLMIMFIMLVMRNLKKYKKHRKFR